MQTLVCHIMVQASITNTMEILQFARAYRRIIIFTFLYSPNYVECHTFGKCMHKPYELQYLNSQTKYVGGMSEGTQMDSSISLFANLSTAARPFILRIWIFIIFCEIVYTAVCVCEWKRVKVHLHDPRIWPFTIFEMYFFVVVFFFFEHILGQTQRPPQMQCIKATQLRKCVCVCIQMI